MRIIGGEHRGRVLKSPEGLSTRPTGDRVRESIFNILNHAGWLDRDILAETAVMDVFAGTGAMGLEALSQGAAQAVFVERDFNAATICRENIAMLGLQAQSTVFTFDALKPTPRPMYLAPRALVFLDPPYNKDLGVEALTALIDRDWLADDAVVVMEMAKKNPGKVPDGFTLHDTRDYGIARVMFLQRNIDAA